MSHFSREFYRIHPLVVALLAVTIIFSPTKTNAIMNLNQESANTVIDMRQPIHLQSIQTRNVGVQCLKVFTELYLQLEKYYKPVYNMVITNCFNTSLPAAQIQNDFLKFINDVDDDKNDDVSKASKTRGASSLKVFQLRTISDKRKYTPHEIAGELFLADFYVIVLDDLQRFRNIMANHVSRRKGSWNPGATFLILFNNPEYYSYEHLITREIFTEMQEQYFVNKVGVLFAQNITTYSFWIMDYYDTKSCRQINLKRMASCDNDRLHPSLAQLKFALKSHLLRITLDNCTFRMCSTIAEPFVEKDCTTGIELRTMAIIKSQLRFDINHSCSNETRGIQDERDSWTGLLGRLDKRECDFILGGYFPDNDVLEHFWASDCYFSVSYTWYAQLADLRPRWLALYSIFARMTWLYFILVLLLTWLFWFFVTNMEEDEPKNFKEFSLAAINAIAVTLCVSVNERPFCVATRIFFFALALYGMNMATVYESKLITIFSNPGYQHQIDSMSEVMDLGIPFGGNKENRDWFDNDNDISIYEQYNDSTIFEPQGDSLEAVRDGQRVILSSRRYILQNPISDKIYGFSSNVFSSPIQIIMKSGFPFLNKINWKIRQMRDSGFFDKIDREFYFNHTILNRIAKMRPTFQENVIVLTPEHLEGSFVILLLGTICSIGVFIAELLVFTCISPLIAKYFNKPSQHHHNLALITSEKKVARERKRAKINRVQKIRFTPIRRRVIRVSKGGKDF